MISAHAVVQGRVQGVGFRVTAQQKAVELGVNGWVKNLSDGNVELVAEGSEDKVDQFINYLRKGPNRFAKVEDVQVEKSENVEGFKKFEVKA